MVNVIKKEASGTDSGGPTSRCLVNVLTTCAICFYPTKVIIFQGRNCSKEAIAFLLENKHVKDLLVRINQLKIELEIRISKRWPKDPTTTAIQLSKCWRKFNDCLKDARFYKVTLVFLNPNQDTGGIISPNQDMQLFNQEAKDLCQKLNNSGENQSILLTGLIDDVNNNQK
jgi:hypothetical protein